MTADQWAALVPVLIVTFTAVAVLIASAFAHSRRAAAFLSALGFCAAFIAACVNRATGGAIPVTPLLVIDPFALYFTGLICLASAATVVLAYGYLENLADRSQEFFVLLTLAALGSIVMVSSTHFASLFLGLELLTISLYGMISYVRDDEHSLEAGVKYLVLAAASSAFLLFGIALIYAETGTMDFAQASSAIISHADTHARYVLYAGIGLFLAGVGFKLGIAPFHMWTPDVYEGAPAPVTAFLATVSKSAMAAALLRFLNGVNVAAYPGLLGAFMFVAVASMFIGNFLALRQRNVKRILAYSSITHLGYLLVAFIASGAVAAEAVMYYLCAYILTSLTAFGVVSVCSTSRLQLNNIDEYRGLFWTRPWLASMFTASLLSLAGIPLTAGFIGKYLVISAGVSAAQWAALVILVVNSAIGIYYYLRIVVAMYTQPGDQALRHIEAMPIAGGIVLSVLTAAVLWLGVYPSPLLTLIRFAVSGFLF